MIDFKSYPTETLQVIHDEIKKELKSRKRRLSVEKRKAFISNFNLRDYESASSANKAILKINSNNLLEPRNLNGKVFEKEKYLPALIGQDWSSVYPESGGESKYYVYIHTDPRERILTTTKSAGGNYGGTPFYVGKGTGNRAFDLKRNQGHGKIIREIISDGFDSGSIVRVLFDNLTESKAYEIEAKLIYFFGTVYQGDRNGVLYNLDVPKTPTMKGLMEKITINRQFNRVWPDMPAHN